MNNIWITYPILNAEKHAAIRNSICTLLFEIKYLGREKGVARHVFVINFKRFSPHKNILFDWDDINEGFILENFLTTQGLTLHPRNCVSRYHCTNIGNQIWLNSSSVSYATFANCCTEYKKSDKNLYSSLILINQSQLSKYRYRKNPNIIQNPNITYIMIKGIKGQ